MSGLSGSRAQCSSGVFLIRCNILQQSITASSLSYRNHVETASHLYDMKRLPPETTDMIIDMVSISQESTLSLLSNRYATFAQIPIYRTQISDCSEGLEPVPPYVETGFHGADLFSSKRSTFLIRALWIVWISSLILYHPRIRRSHCMC